jgi:hypothetical protein
VEIHAHQINRENSIGRTRGIGVNVADIGGKTVYAHAQSLRQDAAALLRRLRQVPLVQGLCVQRQPNDHAAAALQRAKRTLLGAALLSANRIVTFRLSA